MEFTQHQLQQQAAAIQSQLLAIKERLDLLEETRRDQPLVIITEDGNALPWTDQPLMQNSFASEFRVSLGSEWISGPLSLDKAKSLIKTCLSHRLSNKQIFDVREYLGKS